jgi:hypothetical protein
MLRVSAAARHPNANQAELISARLAPASNLFMALDFFGQACASAMGWPAKSRVAASSALGRRVGFDAGAVRLLRFEIFLQVLGFAFDLFSLSKEIDGRRKDEEGKCDSCFHG